VNLRELGASGGLALRSPRIEGISLGLPVGSAPVGSSSTRPQLAELGDFEGICGSGHSAGKSRGKRGWRLVTRLGMKPLGPSASQVIPCHQEAAIPPQTHCEVPSTIGIPQALSSLPAPSARHMLALPARASALLATASALPCPRPTAPTVDYLGAGHWRAGHSAPSLMGSLSTHPTSHTNCNA
jgi:hypothetical protein